LARQVQFVVKEAGNKYADCGGCDFELNEFTLGTKELIQEKTYIHRSLIIHSFVCPKVLKFSIIITIILNA
jgi:hypothetical protein